MNEFKTIINLLFTREFAKKFMAYFLLILFFYVFRWFIWIFFLTFIFSYLFYTSWNFFKQKIDYILNKYSNKYIIIFKDLLSLNMIIIIQYILFILVLFFTISNIFPQINNELSSSWSLINGFNELKGNIINISMKLDSDYDLSFTKEIETFINEIDIKIILDIIINNIKIAWKFIFDILISLFLSFIFLIDRKKLAHYLLWIKNSNFNFLYLEYNTIFKKIVNSFWLILKAQALIALVNTVFTIFGLYLLSFIHWIIFPYILTLWVIVFLCGFIPVLGTFISSIPILFIWYTLDIQNIIILWNEWSGSLVLVVELVILIMLIHFIEAYILNPRIVSNILELPVSLTFLILMASEALFWIAGLLIWIALFYFIIWLLADLDNIITKRKKIKVIETSMLDRKLKT